MIPIIDIDQNGGCFIVVEDYDVEPFFSYEAGLITLELLLESGIINQAEFHNLEEQISAYAKEGAITQEINYLDKAIMMSEDYQDLLQELELHETLLIEIPPEYRPHAFLNMLDAYVRFEPWGDLRKFVN